jgi:hypothetical protein
LKAIAGAVRLISEERPLLFPVLSGPSRLSAADHGEGGAASLAGVHYGPDEEKPERPALAETVLGTVCDCIEGELSVVGFGQRDNWEVTVSTAQSSQLIKACAVGQVKVKDDNVEFAVFSPPGGFRGCRCHLKCIAMVWPPLLKRPVCDGDIGFIGL